MERYQTLAVALRSRELGEADRIIDYVTRDHGRLSVVAKGARRSRKRYGGRLEKFVCVELKAVERRSGSLCRLEDVRVVEYFADMTLDFERIAMGEAWLELAGRLTIPGEEGSRVFDRLLEGWRALSQGGVTPAAFYGAMIVFFEEQGMLAPLQACAQCGDTEVVDFDPENGGAVCRGCSGGRRPRIEKHLAGKLRRLEVGASADTLSDIFAPDDVPALRGLVKGLLSWSGGGPLKSLEVWEETHLNQ